MKRYLQPNERVVISADVRVDVRSYMTNAEIPVPWADLARPKHSGTVALTSDRLIITFNPGNVRVVSVPLANVLMTWERTSEGKKPYPNQVVFILPAGLFCVCELDRPDAGSIEALRSIMHAVSRFATLAARSDLGLPVQSDSGSDGTTDVLMGTAI